MGGRGGPQDRDTGVSLSRTAPQKAFGPALGRMGLWDKPSWGLRLPAWLRHHSECGVQGNLGPGHLSLFQSPSEQGARRSAASGVSPLLSHLGSAASGSGRRDVGGVFTPTELVCGMHPK